MKHSNPFKKMPAPPVTEWINQNQACELLGIKPQSLRNMIYQGKIPAHVITTGVGNNKFFHKRSLMGFDN